MTGEFIIVQGNHKTVYAGPLTELEPAKLPRADSYEALAIYPYEIEPERNTFVLANYFAHTTDDLERIASGIERGRQPSNAVYIDLDDKLVQALKDFFNKL